MIEDKNVRADVISHPFWFQEAFVGSLIEAICKWAEDRNITAEGGATSYTQIPKLIEEVREFEAAENEHEAKLEFGDILVVCIQIARLRGLDMVECLDLAYEKIRHRKGRMVDGRFVKEQ